MVRREIVAAKAGRARVWLNDASPALLGPLEAFHSDPKSRDLAFLRGAVGLRNRIAHGYALVDYARVRREAQAGIPALRDFLLVITSAAGV